MSTLNLIEHSTLLSIACNFGLYVVAAASSTAQEAMGCGQKSGTDTPQVEAEKLGWIARPAILPFGSIWTKTYVKLKKE